MHLKASLPTLLIALPALVFSCMSAVSQDAPDPTAERPWTGTNGATFRGTYSRTLDFGAKIEFLTSSGKTVKVAIENLSKKDQETILAFEKANRAKANPSAIDEDAFKELPVADRSLIPERKPEDYDLDGDESLVDAIWVSLLWWDAAGIAPIPKKGDYDKKAEWLYEELNRYIAKGGRSAATVEDGKEGITQYFKKRLEDVGACKVTAFGCYDAALAKVDLEPGGISKLAAGNDILVLKISMEYANGRNFTVSAAMEKVEEDGTFAIHLFGNRFTGKMAVVADKRPAVPKGKVYELVLNDRLDLPEYYLAQEPRFYFGENGDGFLHLKPYIYKEPGKTVPIP